MAHAASYQKDMADIDSQIAMVQYMEAASKTATTPEEKNAQQIEMLKAQKAGKQADFKKNQIEQRGNAEGFQRLATIAGALKGNAYGANRALANIPTPGGIGVPLFILGFLYFILFPVNGHTRMYWLFLVLFGKASINAFPKRGTSPWDTGSPGVNDTGGNGSNGGQTIVGTFPVGTNPFNPTLPGSTNGVSNTGIGTPVGVTYKQVQLGNGDTGDIATINAIPYFNYNILEQLNGT